MSNKCCICQKKLKITDNKIPIAGFDIVCESCLKRAGIYKMMYSFAEIKEFQTITRRDILHLIEENESEIQEKLPVDNYIGERIKAEFNKELELTRNGISICQKELQKLIPYEQIHDVEFVKASFRSKGYLSIITENAGVAGSFDSLKFNDFRVLIEDQNTILFSKKMNEQADKIYKAILLLMNCTDFDEEIDDIGVDSLVLGMTGHEFEQYCANLLKNNHFSNVSVTKGSGDQGVDVLAEKDGIKYAIQCKLYSTPLGNTPVQEVAAGKTFYGCHVGVVMTNSVFTNGAKELAKATNVLLWDGKKLEALRNK